MKNNPELITAIASGLGSIFKAVKVKLNWRQAVASTGLSIMIGYLMPSLVGYFMQDANQQMTIAISILVGFGMHTLTDIIEEQLKIRFNFKIFDKKDD